MIRKLCEQKGVEIIEVKRPYPHAGKYPAEFKRSSICGVLKREKHIDDI